MLGKTANVEIFGTLAEKKLYSGYITGSRDMRRVYVITDQELHGAIDCMIIAAAIGETSAQTRLVAAPEGETAFTKNPAVP